MSFLRLLTRGVHECQTAPKTTKMLNANKWFVALTLLLIQLPWVSPSKPDRRERARQKVRFCYYNINIVTVVSYLYKTKPTHYIHYVWIQTAFCFVPLRNSYLFHCNSNDSHSQTLYQVVSVWLHLKWQMACRQCAPRYSNSPQYGPPLLQSSFVATIDWLRDSHSWGVLLVKYIRLTYM